MEAAVESSAGHVEPKLPTLPGPRRCPGRFQFSGRMDLVVTKAAQDDSVPAKTVAAGNVTNILHRNYELIQTLWRMLPSLSNVSSLTGVAGARIRRRDLYELQTDRRNNCYCLLVCLLDYWPRDEVFIGAAEFNLRRRRSVNLKRVHFKQLYDSRSFSACKRVHLHQLKPSPLSPICKHSYGVRLVERDCDTCCVTSEPQKS